MDPARPAATSIKASQLFLLLDRATDGDVEAMPSVSPGGTFPAYAADNADRVWVLRVARNSGVNGFLIG